MIDESKYPHPSLNPFSEKHAEIEEVERDLNAVNLRIAYPMTSWSSMSSWSNSGPRSRIARRS